MKIQKFLVLIFCLLSFNACKPEQQEPLKEISNVLSDLHVPVGGTGINLKLPFGFTPSDNFSGFEHFDSGSSIIVIELPATYQEIAPSMTKSNLRTQGVMLQSKRKMKINGKEATLLEAKQMANGVLFSKLILLMPAKDQIIMLNGMYPDELKKEMHQTVLNSLLSVVYEADKKTDPLAAVHFEVDTKDTPLQFTKMIAGSLAYTLDGKIPTKAEGEPFFMVGPSLGVVEFTDERAFAIKRLNKLPEVSHLEMKEINSVTIDNLSGYEIVAYGENVKKHQREMIYQLMLFKGNEYYLMVGMAKANFEENLAYFKKVSNTFHRK